MINLQVGRTYRTRDDSEITIRNKRQDGIFESFHDHMVKGWYRTGRFDVFGRDHPLDLISEVTDQPKAEQTDDQKLHCLLALASAAKKYEQHAKTPPDHKALM